MMPAKSMMSIFVKEYGIHLYIKMAQLLILLKKRLLVQREHSHVIGNAKVDIYIKLKQGVLTNFQKHVYL